MTRTLTLPLLTGTALLALTGPALAGIQDMAGYQGIRVWEATYIAAHQFDFAAGDTRLTAMLAGASLSQAGRDFGAYNGNENYDLYFSDADGSLSANGSYLTIAGNCDVPYNCFNITEVAVRINGSDQLASAVVHAVYGRAGSFTAGSAANAADGSFASYTQLGDTMNDYPNGRMSITLSFDGVPAVPEPGSWMLLLAGMGLIGHRARRRG
ncbi:MAG: PEP-CTERM sorting domain-containing protein [Burkholderiaceae bacterium]|nr:PEP-CTERM sorting domain-containing protein [Burkholderiaceae bacterium]MBT9502999.1 PEP-CTERM sorting domain-containing protein [Burkholderiaceae bacterium]